MLVNILNKLRQTPKHKLLLYFITGYIIIIIIAAFIGAEIALRAKSSWVKGEFLPVGKRGKYAYFPATIESLSRGVLGAVPIKPHRGHAYLGPAELRGTLVRREVLDEQGLMPNGSLAWVSTFVYNGTPKQLGIDFEHTTVHTPVGEMPAWHIPSKHDQKDAITIVVHGHGGQRAQALRVLPALMRTGTATLITTFRNAYGAPKVNKGYLSLGDLESEDIHAALQWAQEHGYKRAVLYGFSMGSNIVLNTIRPHLGPLPIPVSGFVLDSPALDWRDILRWQGQRYGLPKFLAKHVGRFTEFIMHKRSGQNFDAVDQLAASSCFEHPILLFHGTRDRTIPIAQSDALAKARPDLVEYHRIEGAKHIRCWNIDPKQYDQTLEAFMARVLKARE